MSERLRAKDVMTKPRAAVALLLASVAIAGCGNTRSADNEPVSTCGSHDYSRAESSHPVQSISRTLETAQHDVVTLQKRALEAGGSIDLPRYSNRFRKVVEIQATKDNLELLFDRTGWISFSGRVDHINFPLNGEVAHISPGAIACYADNSELVANGTYSTLQQYVHQTAGLER